jgi:hypothetical protein
MFSQYSISYRIIVPEEKKCTLVTKCGVSGARDNGNPNKGLKAKNLLRSPPLEMK